MNVSNNDKIYYVYHLTLLNKLYASENLGITQNLNSLNVSDNDKIYDINHLTV